MMQEEQNALFINPVNPTNAVIFDRRWFERALAATGLVASYIEVPAVSGFQWLVHLVPIEAGLPAADFPEDLGRSKTSVSIQVEDREPLPRRPTSPSV